MENLVGYSSDECEDSIPYQTLEEEESLKENIGERNYPSELVNLNIFLQNYSSQINMSSCFLYLPWRPSLKTMGCIKKAANLAVKELTTEAPQIVEKFDWKSITNGALDYHISLYPNIRGERWQINQLTSNLSSGISTVKINPSLIGHDANEVERMKNLTTLLTKDKGNNGIFLPKKYINFRLKPHLLLFKSSSTENLFLACSIDVSNKKVADFFDSLNNYINENLCLLNMETICEPIAYHISIQMGEAKNLHKLTPKEITSLNSILQKLDLSGHLEEVNIHVNELIIYLLKEEKKFIHIPFII